MTDKQIVDTIEAEAVDFYPMYPIGKLTWVGHIEAKREAYKAGRLKGIDELQQFKDFVTEVSNGQHGELKGDFIVRITNKAKTLLNE